MPYYLYVHIVPVKLASVCVWESLGTRLLQNIFTYIFCCSDSEGTEEDLASLSHGSAVPCDDER